jgi:hypothetical protein
MRNVSPQKQSAPDVIPIILFAYARPDHLQQTLVCLRENHVPLIYAFSDAARTPDKAPGVEEVRRILRAIDWCEVVLTERAENWGLGRSILSGVTEIFKQYEAAIIFEDDLICVPETYQYLCAALNHYRDDPRVMSVTGYTHPRVRPSDVDNLPYFDGRAESWSWGAWPRSWEVMNKSALELMHQCQTVGIDPRRYGADLPSMAKRERKSNIWAVRFLYAHLLNRGLCLRPSESLVDHAGFDQLGTNATEDGGWSNNTLQQSALLPQLWPEPLENPECAALWRKIYPDERQFSHLAIRAVRKLRRTLSGTD